MDDLSLLVDLHRDTERQGPGGADQTRAAISLAGLQAGTGLKIADMGCGSGASALICAQELGAHVTALDLFPDFLRRLEGDAARAGLSERIAAVAASMDDPPLRDGAFDAIWSEGAIYNIGFEAGVAGWRRLLKPGGVLAVTDLTWLTDSRPAELQAHWLAAYPEVDVASVKLGVLEKSGFTPIGYFTLPEACWMANYYAPLQTRFGDFLRRHGDAAPAQAVVDAEKREIALYERFKAYFSYGFYIARKTSA